MDVPSRYQVLPGANPLPWFSGCPIQLHTVRLVRDQLADRVLLQLLALNVTDQPIKSVCLHIICRDTNGTVLQDYPSVLLKNIHASPHCTFRNEQTIPLAAHTVYVDITPKRVFFHDGQIWNRPDFLRGQILPPPTPLDPNDPHAPKMMQEALETGLSSQFYYEEHNDFWYCSCGQPNPIAAHSCGRCCALRRWLQANMRRQAPALRKPPRPDLRADLGDYFGRSPGQYQPILPTPQPQPTSEQLVIDPHTGELISLDKYNSLMRAMYYRKNDPAADPDAPKKQKTSPWIIVLIVFLVLALVVAGIFLILPQTQYGRYQDALTLMEEGDYDAAYTAFAALTGYQDAEDNANFCRYCSAQALYESGDYANAGIIYEELVGYRNSAELAADCQYQQAVAAIEDARYEDAIGYLEKAMALNAANQTYTQKLQECYYNLGFAAETLGDDISAISWYEKSGNYADAPERLLACQQRLTTPHTDEKEEEETPSTDFTADLPSTAGKSQEEMYAYVTSHKNREDQTTFAYLTELCQQNYRDSKQIYDSLYAWKVDMFFNASSSDLTTRLDTASATQTLYIHYIISGGPLDGALTMKYVYQKPNGATGEKILSGTCAAGSTGNIFWRDGIYANNEEQKAGVMTVSYHDASTGNLLASESINITLS